VERVTPNIEVQVVVRNGVLSEYKATWLSDNRPADLELILGKPEGIRKFIGLLAEVIAVMEGY
jgi:hypothetical protein